MRIHLKFSHKILLAVSLIVIVAFALFTAYNDSLQRSAIRKDLDSYLHEMGDVTASNIANWLYGRVLLMETLSQSVAINPAPENIALLLKQQALASTFIATYVGDKEGKFMTYPDAKMP